MYSSQYNLMFKIDREGIHDKYIIYNPLSGAMDIVSQSIVDTVRNFEKARIDESYELIEFLIERGYVFTDKSEEKKRISEMHRIYENTIQENKLIDIVIIPTYACNLRCIYCFEYDIQRDWEFMSDTTLKKAFDAILKLSLENGRNPQITLFGGEPLLKNRREYEVIQQIVNWCRDQNYVLYIVTNGVELAHFVNVIENSTIASIHITIDGPREFHDKRRVFANGKGSFDKIVYGIDAVLDRVKNTLVCVRLNLDKENVESLVEWSDFIKEKGWSRHKNFVSYLSYVRGGECKYFHLCLPPTELLRKVFDLRDQYPQVRSLSIEGWEPLTSIFHVIKFGKPSLPKFRYCSANIDEFCFDPYGYIYPCEQIIGRKEYSIGRYCPELSLDQESLAKWRTSVFDFPKCEKCNVNIICGGGCSFQSALKKGSLRSRFCDPIVESLQIGFNYLFPQFESMANTLEEDARLTKLTSR